MNKKSFISGFILVAVFIAGFSSTSMATIESAMVNAATVMAITTTKTQGHITWRTKPSEIKGMFLRTGEVATFENYLYKGTAYLIAAIGCDDATDVDIALFDENGNLVSKDVSMNSWGVITITPQWSGKYYVKVAMQSAVGGGAHVIAVTGFVN